MAIPDAPDRTDLDEATTRPSGPLGQRRAFLVNKRYQLKASLLTATVVLVLLVFVNLTLYSASRKSSAQILADAPALEKVIRSQDRVELYLILLASLVFLVGVFVVSILETHKTAGAAYNLQQRLAELRHGRYCATLKLRKGDNLIELEGAFNELARALRDRESEDAETLEQLAAEVERGNTSITAAVASLRGIATLKRTRVDDV